MPYVSYTADERSKDRCPHALRGARAVLAKGARAVCNDDEDVVSMIDDSAMVTEIGPGAPAAALPDVLELVESYRSAGQAPVLVICDHGGHEIPSWLGDLGLPERDRVRHIGWDIGAADMTRVVADRLDAPAVLCHVSRLVIDPNRRPGEPTSIPRVSDGTVIPANQHVDETERRRRFRTSFRPYHRAIARKLGEIRRRTRFPAVISVHSCTDVMGGMWRPWHVGVLWNRDERLAAPVLEQLRADRGLTVGANQPYSGRIHNGYSVPFHGERNGLPHVSFEVRQDLIDTRERAEAWGERLAAVLRAPLADPALYRGHGG
jgi:predicted N-formylglutamate amidohydrolase